MTDDVDFLAFLDAQARSITVWWKFGPIDLVFEGDPYAHIEAVLHELSHAGSGEGTSRDRTPRP